MEKEALAGVLFPVCVKWTVDLMVCRGYPSVSFLAGAAEEVRASGKPLRIYYLGDLDPSGKDIPRAIRDRLDSFGLGFSLVELAVNRDQVTRWNLPSRPTKRTDSRANGFKGESVELDAVPSNRLRAIVDGAIRAHVDSRQVELLQIIEAEERGILERLADEVGR